MSLLYRVLFSWKCTSTHHKLAMDALRHLQNPDADRWRKLFLKYIEIYLDGSKAPDKKFKDFRNHVLHVEDNYWGGAIDLACDWYDRLVNALREKNWQESIYCAGVLSHYFTDPFHPFHTGQTENEGTVHRASEWSVAKSYDQLQELLESRLGGYPYVEIPTKGEWLANMIKDGARLAHQDYDLLLNEYDLVRGVIDPPAGLTDLLKERIALLLGAASVGFSRVLDRAFWEANATPPSVGVSLHTFLSVLTIPIFWITGKLADRKERAIVNRIYKEYRKTGQVVKRLPEDERVVLQAWREEVDSRTDDDDRPIIRFDEAKTSRENVPKAHSLPSGNPGQIEQIEEVSYADHNRKQRKTKRSSKSKQTSTSQKKRSRNRKSRKNSYQLRFHLQRADEIEAAPSIGQKTAARLNGHGIFTVEDLLKANPRKLAKDLDVSYIDEETIETWQSQSLLVCRIPGLRGHDAQILVACDMTTPEDLVHMEPDKLLALIKPFLETEEGERIAGTNSEPNLAEVTDWIESAKHARSLKAA